MARFDIVSINKMSCGSSRGLLDMTIAFDKELMQKLVLLKREDKVDGEEQGICTETGTYKYAKTECIHDYKNGQVSALATESNASSLILDETQKYISAGTVSSGKQAV